METTISVFVADDHPMVLEGLEKSIKNHEIFTFSGSTAKSSEVLKTIEKLQPDILLLDYQFTGQAISGIEICHQIASQELHTQIIMISSFTDSSLVETCIEKGARGFVLKTAPFDEYADAITTVYTGGLFYSRDIRQILLKRQKKTRKIKFTRTEKEVLALIAEGLSSKNIAKKLCRERSTIDTHRKNILSKLQLMDEAEKKSKNITFYLAKFNLMENLDRL